MYVCMRVGTRWIQTAIKSAKIRSRFVSFFIRPVHRVLAHATRDGAYRNFFLNAEPGPIQSSSKEGHKEGKRDAHRGYPGRRVVFQRISGYNESIFLDSMRKIFFLTKRLRRWW